MDDKTVIVTFDVKRCDTKGKDPAYRLWLDDELFAERPWIDENHYYEELMQISAPPGHYKIWIETVPPSPTEFKASEFQIKSGPARITDFGDLEISHENK